MKYTKKRYIDKKLGKQVDVYTTPSGRTWKVYSPIPPSSTSSNTKKTKTSDSATARTTSRPTHTSSRPSSSGGSSQLVLTQQEKQILNKRAEKATLQWLGIPYQSISEIPDPKVRARVQQVYEQSAAGYKKQIERAVASGDATKLGVLASGAEKVALMGAQDKRRKISSSSSGSSSGSSLAKTAANLEVVGGYSSINGKEIAIVKDQQGQFKEMEIISKQGPTYTLQELYAGPKAAAKELRNLMTPTYEYRNGRFVQVGGPEPFYDLPALKRARTIRQEDRFLRDWAEIIKKQGNAFYKSQKKKVPIVGGVVGKAGEVSADILGGIVELGADVLDTTRMAGTAAGLYLSKRKKQADVLISSQLFQKPAVSAAVGVGTLAIAGPVLGKVGGAIGKATSPVISGAVLGAGTFAGIDYIKHGDIGQAAEAAVGGALVGGVLASSFLKTTEKKTPPKKIYVKEASIYKSPEVRISVGPAEFQQTKVGEFTASEVYQGKISFENGIAKVVTVERPSVFGIEIPINTKITTTYRPIEGIGNFIATKNKGVSTSIFPGAKNLRIVSGKSFFELSQSPAELRAAWGRVSSNQISPGSLKVTSTGNLKVSPSVYEVISQPNRVFKVSTFKSQESPIQFVDVSKVNNNIKIYDNFLFKKTYISKDNVFFASGRGLASEIFDITQPKPKTKFNFHVDLPKSTGQFSFGRVTPRFIGKEPNTLPITKIGDNKINFKWKQFNIIIEDSGGGYSSGIGIGKTSGKITGGWNNVETLQKTAQVSKQISKLLPSSIPIEVPTQIYTPKTITIQQTIPVVLPGQPKERQLQQTMTIPKISKAKNKMISIQVPRTDTKIITVSKQVSKTKQIQFENTIEKVWDVSIPKQKQFQIETPKQQTKIISVTDTKLKLDITYDLPKITSPVRLPKIELVPGPTPPTTPPPTSVPVPRTELLGALAFPFITLGRTKLARRGRFRKRTKYTPSIEAVMKGITIPRAPKGFLTGIGLRPVVKKAKKSKKKKKKVRKRGIL